MHPASFNNIKAKKVDNWQSHQSVTEKSYGRQDKEQREKEKSLILWCMS